MAVVTSKLGPGTFTLSDPAVPATPIDFSCQLLAAVVEYDKTKEDDETTLCGDVVAGDTTYTATFSGTFFQDLSDPAGIVAYSWANKGTEQDFTYTPNTADAATVTGRVVIDPLPIGGDEPKAKMRAEFTWDCVGEPTATFGGVAGTEAETETAPAA